MSIFDQFPEVDSNGQRRDSPGVTLSMGEWWEQLSGGFRREFLNCVYGRKTADPD